MVSEELSPEKWIVVTAMAGTSSARSLPWDVLDDCFRRRSWSWGLGDRLGSIFSKHSLLCNVYKLDSVTGSREDNTDIKQEQTTSDLIHNSRIRERAQQLAASNYMYKACRHLSQLYKNTIAETSPPPHTNAPNPAAESKRISNPWHTSIGPVTGTIVVAIVTIYVTRISKLCMQYKKMLWYLSQLTNAQHCHKSLPTVVHKHWLKIK